MMGFGYRLAHTPESGIEAATDYRPDVVLLDIGLPGMNGFDLCVRLKALPELAGTVFVAQTGWAGEEYRRRASEVGFEHFLVKPVALETLEEVLKDIFGRIRP
jgi:CheY-like chemotaxis protein